MDAELVDRIYECSVVPESWPCVLDELGRLVEGTGGTLFITKGNNVKLTSSPASSERAGRLVKEGWFWRGQAITRAFASHHAGFLTNDDIFSPGEWDSEPMIRDFFRPQGISWFAGTTFRIPTSENVLLIVPRWTERGPIERDIVRKLDELRPHLARSALISARLQLERARVAGETLAALGLPALVLNDCGKVLAANALIEGLTPYVQWRALDRVSLADSSANRLLQDAMATIGADERSVRSFPLRDADSGATMVAHLIPVRLSARDIFVRCVAALVLTPVVRPQAPPVELVRSLFDLTPAEARVARSLVSGKSAQAIASEGGVSLNTIRTHVRGLLEKTGCNRQSEVITLLSSVSSLPPGGVI